jgi:hypothetical protein
MLGAGSAARVSAGPDAADVESVMRGTGWLTGELRDNLEKGVLPAGKGVLPAETRRADRGNGGG